MRAHLSILLPPGYPNTTDDDNDDSDDDHVRIGDLGKIFPPTVTLESSRGLSESHTTTILQAVQDILTPPGCRRWKSANGSVVQSAAGNAASVTNVVEFSDDDEEPGSCYEALEAAKEAFDTCCDSVRCPICLSCLNEPCTDYRQNVEKKSKREGTRDQHVMREKRKGRGRRKMKRGESQVVRLFCTPTCYHAFHRSCFFRYWCVCAINRERGDEVEALRRRAAQQRAQESSQCER